MGLPWGMWFNSLVLHRRIAMLVRDPTLTLSGLHVRCVHGFAFRAPLLSQVNGKHHNGQHREEFFLPVLDAFEPEMNCPQISTS